ncbi:Dihydroorotate dehydrogenase (quinone), mitochondrial [Pseudolycoriella hygida]|uniref:Dihydroorotate dehydrogenase (quinone), mitochondrial n=1 Tax=Pseudolycoriella hygida TaxID=35572 RepID=A0A9Q0RUP7_9DIPT|nr:Dihydroorotate dehydrogenase (quinone), mitochondrial [Pseudolycoriella hygida]
MSFRQKMTLFQKLKSTLAVGTGSTAVFVSINIYKNNEQFYNNWLMPFVHLFDPESCHRVAVLACKYRLFPKAKENDPESLSIRLFDRTLRNPLGIAAGFDKHAEAIAGLHAIGFGFVEIGSVTPLAQDGNPKPRVFRLSEDKAIINRYGFNSDGHDEVLQRIKTLREDSQTTGAIIGVNLGKNKESTDYSDDYVIGVEKFAAVADYLVINVSSPNTPGLRDLQHENHLKQLLSNVINKRNSLTAGGQRHVPIFLKLAPDLTNDEAKRIAKVIKQKGCVVDGIIISNTTVERNPSLVNDNKNEIGGLSGAPLTDRSTELIRQMYRLTDGKVPIIGVGGVFSGKDAFDKILAGASAIQIYSSFIYHGPPIVPKIKKELGKLLMESGYANVAEAVGRNAKK